MTKREWIKTAVLAACGSLLPRRCSPAAEEVAKDDPGAAATESDIGLAVEDIVTAYRLVDYGRRMDPRKPLALLAAAEILYHTNVFPAEKFGKDRFQGPKTSLEQDFSNLRGPALKLMEEAIAMAKTNKQDVAAVEAMSGTIRGRDGLNGPLMVTMELAAGQTDAYQIKYKKREWAHIAVVADGDATLSLKAVNDQRETRGADRGALPHVAFVPGTKDGAEFTVTVTNRGKERVVYSLFTN